MVSNTTKSVLLNAIPSNAGGSTTIGQGKYNLKKVF